jgi:hypothetical protein
MRLCEEFLFTLASRNPAKIAIMMASSVVPLPLSGDRCRRLSIKSKLASFSNGLRNEGSVLPSVVDVNCHYVVFSSSSGNSDGGTRGGLGRKAAVVNILQ